MISEIDQIKLLGTERRYRHGGPDREMLKTHLAGACQCDRRYNAAKNFILEKQIKFERLSSSETLFVRGVIQRTF
jgi:hypothetical protein